MNEKVKELAQAVVETVGDMKLSELINNVEGQMLRDFFYVAKSITTAEESKCKCSSAAMDSTACDKKPAKKKASSKK